MSSSRETSPWPGGIPPRIWAERISAARSGEERRRIAGQVPEPLRPMVRSHLDTLAMLRRARARSGRRSRDSVPGQGQGRGDQEKMRITHQNASDGGSERRQYARWQRRQPVSGT